jgi:putative SOS response-associated peptidase YedK
MSTIQVDQALEQHKMYDDQKVWDSQGILTLTSAQMDADYRFRMQIILTSVCTQEKWLAMPMWLWSEHEIHLCLKFTHYLVHV